MILGVGTDIVSINRIEKTLSKFEDSFLSKCFTPNEIVKSEEKTDKIAFLAKRFTAKEAFFKALGTGFTNGVSWQDLEISNNDLGAPIISVSNKSKDILIELSKSKDLNNINIHLSISDDKPFAISTVIIEER